MSDTKQQVLYADPLDLMPYENNPRMNDYAVKKVMASIQEYGFRNPIRVDKDMVIIAGHTRREAAILLGLKSVPYIIDADMTPVQAQAYRIADNKLGELAVWDEPKLRDELIELQDEDIDLTTLGFTDIDLQELLDEAEDLEADGEEDLDVPYEEKTTLPMLRFGSNSLRISEDELTILCNRYNEYVESRESEGFVYWLLKRGL